MRDEAENLLTVDERASTVPPSTDTMVGRVVDGRYRIEAVLGEGGMGVVYRARHVVLGKQLALKVLRSEVSRDAELLTRFRQEAQSATAIGNQHIIDVSDFGTLPDGATYFVMEFLDGISLAKAIEEQAPMPAKRVCHIGKQLCEALGSAHERNIVHRDLKPDNIYLIRRGKDSDFVKVLDFGIAKVGGSSSRLTQVGQVFGTPHYMSPQQAAGQGVDHRTDIYALGVIFYEMITGRVPFDADSLMGILSKHMYEPPVPPRQLGIEIDCPPAFEAIILKCLAKSVEARYQTMAEVREDLERFEGGEAPAAIDASAPPQVAGATAIGKPAPGTAGTAVPVDTAQRVDKTPVGREAHSRWPLLVGLGAAAVLGVGTVALVHPFGAGGDGTAEIQAGRPRERTLGPTAPEATTGTGDTARSAAPEPRPPSEPPAGPAASAAVASGADVPTEEPAVPARSTTIRITSEPAGAEVWQGERSLGQTPLEIERPVGEGTVDLSLRRPGYVPTSVRLSALTEAEIHLSLERATGPTGAGRRPNLQGSSASSGSSSAGDRGPGASSSGGSSPWETISDPREIRNPWD